MLDKCHIFTLSQQLFKLLRLLLRAFLGVTLKTLVQIYLKNSRTVILKEHQGELSGERLNSLRSEMWKDVQYIKVSQSSCGAPRGANRESCVLVPGCHANPVGLSSTDPELDKQTEEKKVGWMGSMTEK